MTYCVTDKSLAWSRKRSFLRPCAQLSFGTWSLLVSSFLFIPLGAFPALPLPLGALVRGFPASPVAWSRRVSATHCRYGASVARSFGKGFLLPLLWESLGSPAGVWGYFYFRGPFAVRLVPFLPLGPSPLPRTRPVFRGCFRHRVVLPVRSGSVVLLVVRLAYTRLVSVG